MEVLSYFRLSTLNSTSDPNDKISSLLIRKFFFDAFVISTRKASRTNYTFADEMQILSQVASRQRQWCQLDNITVNLFSFQIFVATVGNISSSVAAVQ